MTVPGNPSNRRPVACVAADPQTAMSPAASSTAVSPVVVGKVSGGGSVGVGEVMASPPQRASPATSSNGTTRSTRSGRPLLRTVSAPPALLRDVLEHERRPLPRELPQELYIPHTRLIV